ncbi:MAG TPA: glycosyltransferase family 4 protein [Solirubrobacteraceae bacterium]|jgi:glycosyltransferase involved in cell wall biosynthesis|nr:glycosyltransferase family 4 protein [Solirubrobacteraceae bacterium]
MRVLFFNEGNLGAHVMGQGQLEGALRTGLDASAGVEARFAGMAPMGRLAAALATRPLEPLARAGLDPHTLRWHAVQSLRARAQLTRELRSWPADAALVHSHSVALALGAPMRSVPVALSLDTTVADWSTMPAWRAEQRHAAALLAPSVALERRALARAALVLAWTAWARAAAARRAPAAHVVEHHPGIDLERYRPAERRPRSRPRVLFVGGRFREKGGEDLLAALGGQLGESVELDLVTPAEVAERPGVRVHRLGPSDPRLLDLQQQADVFCLPSYGDAAPWAVLEAMACGTPVLASRVGGIPDMLGQGEAGVLVACGRREELARALRALLEDAPLRAALATAARARCERDYDARAQFSKLIGMLEQARAAFTPAPPAAAAGARR